MPVYNGAKYIRDALDSLLSQTFTDFELVISDNASTDSTQIICEEYACRDSRIVYVRQKINAGAVANFEFVLERARASIFMWAAYDDKWEKNYLMEATSFLKEREIDFIFPSFSVTSIQLKIRKIFDADLYRFIESVDRQRRVMQFIALHHDSHKCNIVYSLFRTKFLKDALKIQNIVNDGALGAVIVGLGRGEMLRGTLFSKRYPWLWPGSLSFIFARLYRNRSKEFELAKAAALSRLGHLFPEYLDDIKSIFDFYCPYTYERNYQIGPVGHESNIEGEL
jgi:glycosyltransferase involved in cell wall biosynthesis